MVMGVWGWKGGVEGYSGEGVFVGVLMVDYFEGWFVFGLVMKGKRGMGVGMMGMGIVLNVMNVRLLGGRFLSCGLGGK